MSLPKEDRAPLWKQGIQGGSRDSRWKIASQWASEDCESAFASLVHAAREKKLSRPKVADLLFEHHTARVSRWVAEAYALCKPLLRRSDFEAVAYRRFTEDPKTQQIAASVTTSRSKTRQERGAKQAARKWGTADLPESFIVLASRMGIPTGMLAVFYTMWAGRKNFDGEYRSIKIPKSSGKTRKLDVPSALLKQVQRRLLHSLLDPLELHSACHGFRRGRSTRTGAIQHVGAEVVLNLDFRDFFPSIHAGRVYGLFRSIGLSDDDTILRFLTDLVVCRQHLPQGAPTSPVIANLVARRLDSRLDGLVRTRSGNYTRYADDLTISGSRSVLSLLPSIRSIIREEGFQEAKEKTRVQTRGRRQDVTGLTVNVQVSVPRALRRRLRAAVHATTLGRAPMWKGQPLSMTALAGHLSYLASVHPAEAEDLRNQLRACSP